MSTGNMPHSPDEGAVLLEKEAPVAIITLSRPATLNALFIEGVQAYLEKRKPHWRGQ